MSDILARIDELKKKLPPPTYRAPHGKWVRPAWIVRGLVESGHGVMDAVRAVVNDEGLEPADRAIKSIRQGYYSIKDRPWSENPDNKETE